MVRSIFPTLLLTTALLGQSPMFRGGPAHSGSAVGEPIRRFVGTAWTVKTEGPVRSSPAVVDGVAYVGSGDGRIYAIETQTGRATWSHDVGAPVHSSPAVVGGRVYVAARNGMVLALDARSGSRKWTHQMGGDLLYHWEFDYFQSSPTVVDDLLYVGGGDGSLCALKAADGTIVWKAELGSRVRSTPAVADGLVVVGDFAGYLHAFDAKTGTHRWKQATEGASIDAAPYGFDRSALVASPAIADGRVFIGGRDGFLYAFDLATGHELWRFDHKVSWVPTSPAVARGLVIAGSSDGRFVQAVDAVTGTERWRFRSRKPVWSSPLIAGDVVYIADYDGFVWIVDAATGREISNVRLGGVIHASPVLAGSRLLVGCDDGTLTALAGVPERRDTTRAPRLAVYWDTTGVPGYFFNGVDAWIRDYFVGCGYERLDNAGFIRLLDEQTHSRMPSAVVVAHNQVPASIANDTTTNNPLRRYLDTGGKLILLNHNPLAFVRDSADQVVDIDFFRVEKVFGVRPAGKATDAVRGWFASRATADGRRWGLREWWMGMGGVDPTQVTTVLALDEAGGAGAWVKSYGGPEGTGLVQLWISRDTPGPLTDVRPAVEYGLR